MTRFAPTRAGIIGLWDYADEEFVFADGWLVLRGPNGSGKTKALELLFPFLLDGNISPRRLNPFASQDRTMKSNLLFRGKENGLGYVWMEFSDGERHVTIGIGLRASKHQDAVKRWHFVVEGRLGVDFGLIGADDRLLNRKELIAQLPEGTVTDAVREYRERVNTALFGLETERYEQMLELILTLRRPQLAKELDPESLSDTLAEGLRPLDERLIVDAAKSFEDMEEVSRTLASLRAADEQVARFLTLYGTYARAQARLAVTGVDARMSAVESSLQQEADAERAAGEARSALEQRTEAAEAAAERVTELGNALQGLKDSDAYRSRLELEDLRKSVGAAEEQAATLAGVAESSAQNLEEAEGEAERLTEASERVSNEVERLVREAGAHAERSGTAWEFHDDAEVLRRSAAAAAEQRRTDMRLVGEAVSALDAEAARRGHAEESASAAEVALESALAALTAAHGSVDAERETLEEQLRLWAGEHREALRTDLGEEIAGWVAAVEAESAPSLRERATERTRAAREDIQRRRHELSVHLSGVEETVARTQAAWESVRDEHQDAPEAPRWRDDGRAGRDGAPLWKLVRFQQSVSDRDAAAVEAALEAAGILDAWVGGIGDASDQTLRALPEPDRPQQRTLADYLECEDDAEPSVVSPVLGSIAVRSAEAGDDRAAYSIVDLDGRFAHGSVAGRAAKDAPEYIGATARRRRREQRMRELEADLDRLRGEARALGDGVRGCEAEALELDGALQAMPGGVELLKALRDVAGKELMCSARQDDLETARTRLDEAVARQHAAAQRLQEIERRCALLHSDIETVRSALAQFEGSVRDLRFALKDRTDLRERLGEQRARVGRLASAAAEMSSKAADAEESHRGLRARLESIERSLDADAATIFEQINTLESETGQAEREAKAAGERREAAVKDDVRAEDAVENARARTVAAIGEARVASADLRPFCDDDLLGVIGCRTGHRWPGAEADPGSDVLPGAVTSLLENLRSATAEVQATENSAKAAVTRVNNALQEIMAQLPATGLDHHIRWDNASGIIAVEVDTDEGRRAIGRYGAWLHEQREEQEQLLTEKEQHVLEDALLTSLTGQIHQRVLESKDLVEEMDLAMRERRTSSGLRIGVSWLLKDLDPAERELFSLFNAAPAKLSTMMPQIRRYFADRIKQERARSKSETTYRDLLADVLDYRKWRKFEFTLVRPDGSRQRLTKRVHSQLSGGEQSVALHLPLFAAANAVFSSAAEHAPRMIGLDEAFAGVDEKGRGELMSLAAKFDLRLIMTGFDLWATVPEVAGAAHYSLSHDEATAMVSAMLMVWNGAENTEAYDYDGSLAASLGSPGTRNAPS
ncbi:TIGR02680 family protein [Glycomyces sp. L485]|uniref:TIGR02680 family protein n=1 Tax=Glycomyces sp. L485 TaxID=2909235 RepID=UPI001F4BBDCD|nr:TIGR02680 family protein [Glycomyces sp. L485]MCH7231060.1 TIGR02680 family protein [Glycomyces sp. L485]